MRAGSVTDEADSGTCCSWLLSESHQLGERLMSGNGFNQLTTILPSRRVVIPALTVAVGMGALTGLLLGIFRPPALPAATVASSTESAGPTAAALTSPRASASATPTVTPTVRTIAATQEAPPGQFIESPWTKKGLEFGTLQDMGRDGNGIWLKLQRTRLLTGDAARKYLAAQGKGPKDFAADPTGGRVTQFRLRPDATVFGDLWLGDGATQQTRQYSVDEFYDIVRNVLDNGTQPTFWVRHDNGIPTLPAIYLAEQYLP